MPIDPHIAPETIYIGPAHIVTNPAAEKASWNYIWVDGEVTVELARSELDVQVAGYGQVVAPSTDEVVNVTFTPANRVDAAMLSWLYGPLFSARPGASWFGQYNTPLGVHTLDGRLLVISNCRPTSFPGINFGVGSTRWNGSVTCTGVVKHDVARGAAGALFTPWADSSFDASPDEDEFPQVPCKCTWAPLGSGPLEAMGPWTVTPTAALRPVTTANLGTVDYRVDTVSLEVSAAPANITESQLWGDYAIGANRILGTNVPGGQMVITEDNPGVTITMPNVVWVTRPTRFSTENPIAGDCVWRARRVHDGSGWSAIATIGITPANG